jgi:hypothetical protein
VPTAEIETTNNTELGPHQAEYEAKMGDLALIELAPRAGGLKDWGRDPDQPKLSFTEVGVNPSFPPLGQETKLKALPGHVQPHHSEALDPTDEKALVLNAVVGTIKDSVKNGIEQEKHGGQIDWNFVANDLVDQAVEIKDQKFSPELNQRLIGAVVCSQFTPEEADRFAFLKRIYKEGLEQEAYAACSTSGLVTVTSTVDNGNGVSFRRVEDLGRAFGADRDVAFKYFESREATSPTEKKEGRRVLQKRLAEQYETGAADPATIEQAVDASTHGPKISAEVLDTHKVERFALQQYFIGKQMRQLFPDGDYANSPFAQALASKRNEVSDNTLSSDEVEKLIKLGRDRGVEKLPLSDKVEAEALEILFADLSNLSTQASADIEELSQPVIQEFTLPETIRPGEVLSRPQLANQRFMKLAEKAQDSRYIAGFISFEKLSRHMFAPIDQSMEIWTVSEDGAAAPRIAEDILYSIITEGLKLKHAGQKVDEDELFMLAQQNRGVLMSIAGSHLADLVTVDSNYFVKHSKISDIGSADAPSSFRLFRDETDALRLESTPPLSEIKGALEEYIGATMGCPALRITSDDAKELSDKLMYGSKNMIDHVLATIINEAHARGYVQPI